MATYMDQLYLMKVFATVAEEEGFASAGRKLKMSPPAVTRAIASLEKELGVNLLNRTTRFVRATEAGKGYLEDVKKILHDVERANEAVTGINAQPRGLLSITAPVLFGQLYVMPTVVDYLSRYPETRINTAFLDRVVNLLEEGFDIGIRIGELPDSSMHARRIGQTRLILVASQEYLHQYGAPHSPEQLSQHTVIASSSGSFALDWYFNLNGKKFLHPLKPRLNVTTNQAAINAAVQNFGITRVLSYQVNEELEHGKLEIILPEFELPPLPIHIIHREGRLTSAKVRAFIDLMTERLKTDLNSPKIMR